LEAAFGPGYLAIELAKLGEYKITGLDISSKFVQISSQNAKQSGVNIGFRQGGVENMPFPDESFDPTICTSAFKNIPF
jgi:ubiquinone/menaquinone biosynthesis C-methylase UbiE